LSDERWILIAITLIQVISLIGRWTGKIDITAFTNSGEIKKIKDIQYKFIQWQQEVSGKVGIIENDVQWIKNLLGKK
jgi:hypothetical protein